MQKDNFLFLYNKGLKKLAGEVTGGESIHMGIRPFGFHAGNLVSLYIYPYLFCEEVEKNNKPVNFTFFFSINDYEQDELDGPDYRKYPFNIHPKETSLGYLLDTNGCHEFMIDHWLPTIKGSILKLKDRFPGIKIYFIKNSQLKNDLKFKEILTSTIINPIEQLDIYRRFTDKDILNEPVQFAGAVCPFCHKTKGTTNIYRVNDEYVRWNCDTCGASLNQPYINFDYWFYHKPLFTARLSIFNIDITFSGDDHFNDGDFLIRKEFIKRFNPGLKIPKMFFAPLVLTVNGQRMSKTQKNAKFGNPQKLLEFCRRVKGNTIQLRDDLIINDLKNNEEYLNFF
jgi:hypothetical protein